MTKDMNLQSLFCGILFCISVTALIIACLAFTKKGGGKGEYYKGAAVVWPNLPPDWCMPTVPGRSCYKNHIFTTNSTSPILDFNLTIPKGETLVIASGSNLIITSSGKINNNGTFNIKGTCMTNPGMNAVIINNDGGTIQCSGLITNEGVLWNQSGGTITGDSSSGRTTPWLANKGYVNNNGTINNKGSIFNLVREGEPVLFENTGILNNPGIISNYSKMTTNGTLNNNNGTIMNDGAITNGGGTITNDKGTITCTRQATWEGVSCPPHVTCACGTTGCGKPTCGRPP